MATLHVGASTLAMWLCALVAVVPAVGCTASPGPPPSSMAPATGTYGGVSCSDAAAALAPRRDAGPADVSVACLPSEGSSCSTSSVEAGTPPPDPATWGCYVDSDCDVFPDRPFCDGNRCSGAQAAVTCTPNAQDLRGPSSPEVTHTYAAVNRTVTDHCDANGNLIGYECETKLPPCSPEPNGCDGPLVFTGQAIALPNLVDCAGACLDGRCDGRCPQQGDQVTLVGEDMTGEVLIHNDSDGRTYACARDPNDNGGANANCAHVLQGKGVVMGRSVADQHCTGAAFGNISVVFDVPTSGLTCGYFSCGIRPMPNCNFL